MSTAKEGAATADSAQLESTEYTSLSKLAKGLAVDVAQFSGTRVVDIMGRIRVGDIEGVSETTGVDRRKASHLVRRYNEMSAGIEERGVLRTSDARKLERDILAIIAGDASSTVARSKLLLHTPSTNVEKIRAGLETCLQGKQIYDDLKRGGKLDAVKSLLASDLSLSLLTSAGKRRVPRTMSDVVRYFLARKGPLGIAQRIFADDEFREVRALVTWFSEGIDPRGLDEIRRTMQDVESSGSEEDIESAVSDAEILINDKLRGEGLNEERARRIVEEGIDEVIGSLKMSSEEENTLRRAAFDQISIPFEFDKVGLRKVVQMWNQRQVQEREARATRVDIFLERYLDLAERTVTRVVLLDQMLAVASAMEKYNLVIPTIGIDGISFSGGRSLFLAKELSEGRIAQAIQPVNYGIGRSRLTLEFDADRGARNVVMLTGANSGGKTTLLTTVATIHILTLLGLPVPCEQAEIVPLPLYLFRRRMTRKVGSLEQAMSSLIPVFADRHRKVVLMDEFEALTEPGAAGRILATMMNAAAGGSSLVLLVTHLARETLPYVKLPIRIDGIEARDLDTEGELVVDRQPRFNHIGSSTPKLIIMKLSRGAKKKNLQSLYNDILNALESESPTVQTPLRLSWLMGDEERREKEQAETTTSGDDRGEADQSPA